MGHQKIISSIQKPVAMFRYHIKKHLLSNPIRHILSPFCNNMIPNKNIINLFNPTNGRQNPSINFLISEAICRETRCERSQCLGSGLLIDHNNLLRQIHV
uniref:Uncharacterized protein n=1 Tax=Opuntia streptacantha TaxID=393608 RepID=A0A7C8YD96_OPUST